MTQIPFAPAAGFVQEATPVRIKCAGCAAVRPPGPQVCPSCGRARDGLAGEEYMRGGHLERTQWVYDQSVVENRGGREIRHMAAKAVLLALTHFDGPGGRIIPSIGRLSHMAGCSRRTVNEALGWLERQGWIVREQRRRGGRQTTSRYVVQQAETARSEDLLSAKSALGQSAKSA